MPGRTKSQASKPPVLVQGKDAVDRKPLPSGANARMNARIALALALAALGLWTAAGFLPALIWAGILAMTLWPLYTQFAQRVMAGPSSGAAFVFTLIVALVLFTPMAHAVYQMAEQGDVLVGWLKRVGVCGVVVFVWLVCLLFAAVVLVVFWFVLLCFTAGGSTRPTSAPK